MDQIYPPMMDVVTKTGRIKSVPQFNPLAIFSYYPGLTSEFYKDTFPQITPEIKSELDSVINEVTLDEDIMKSLSVLARTKLSSNKLTPENLQILLNICDNKEDFIDITLPMDYEVGTAENLIRNNIRTSKYKIQRKLVSAFSRQPRGSKISLYELQNAINKITRVTEDGINPLQEDTDTNALATLSQGSKAYFKAKNPDTGKYESTRLRPKYFVGIIVCRSLELIEFFWHDFIVDTFYQDAVCVNGRNINYHRKWPVFYMLHIDFIIVYQTRVIRLVDNFFHITPYRFIFQIHMIVTLYDLLAISRKRY